MTYEEFSSFADKVHVLSEKTNDALKTVAFHIDKGGTGKTLHSYEFAGFCADVLNKRVLVIDGDRSRNLTKTFSVNGELTIREIFKPDGKMPIYHTNNKNIDIIVGDANFTDEGAEANNWATKYLEFYYWLSDNYDYLNKMYDIIIIDTHNDTSRCTFNLLVGTDVVVNVVKPDTNSFGALQDFVKNINKVVPATKVRNGRSFSYGYDAKRLVLVTDVTYYGNNPATEVSQFIDEVEQVDGYIGIVRSNKLFLKSTLENKGIFELFNELTPAEQASKDKFMSHLQEVYLRIYYEACKKCFEKI